MSPNTIFTKQYSIKAKNTKIVQTDMNASTAVGRKIEKLLKLPILIAKKHL